MPKLKKVVDGIQRAFKAISEKIFLGDSVWWMKDYCGSSIYFNIDDAVI